jgi:hypothetical protein
MAVIVHDNASALHPLQLAGGVLYSNGDIEVSWMMKALGMYITVDDMFFACYV